MRKLHFINYGKVLITLLIFGGMISACQNPDTGTGKPGLTTTESYSGTGKIMGIVTDKEEFLPRGTAPQNYSGATIRVYKAVATGGYSQQCGNCPKIPGYDQGDIAAEVISGDGGKWQVELDAGAYYIQAFYGGRSYSEHLGLIELKQGEIKKVDLYLMHGI